MRFEITRYFATNLAAAAMTRASAPRPPPAAPAPRAPSAVSLQAPGHATWRAEVAVRTGSEPIRVKLTKKP